MWRLILVLFVSLSFSISIYPQCDCDPLPDPSGTIETVSNVSELQAALHNANQNNGNYTILLKDGEYILNNNLLYINDQMINLTIRGESGNRDNVVIKGQGMGGGVGYIFNVAASNFTLADMTIGWCGNHAVQIHAEHNADDALIQNVKFVDIREQMIKVSGSEVLVFSDRGKVQCCEFEFTAGVAYQYYTGGIDAHRAKDWEIRLNTFKHIRSPDSGLAEHAIHFWSDSENTLVENNTIINCDRGIGFGLGDRGHKGGTIKNNWVHTSRDVGIGLENSSNTNVYHNTLMTENYFNSIEYRFDGTVNAHIANNLSNENIAARNGGTGQVVSNYKYPDTSIFEDPGNHNYHLNDSYPEIVDMGVSLGEINVDFDCDLRMVSSLPDIGADELNSTTGFQDQLLDNKIKIYPNPCQGAFYLKLDQNSTVTLLNMNSKLLYKSRIEKGTHFIELTGIPTGIYIIQIENEGAQISKKLILSH
jgi:hypothetical protein